MIETWNEYHEGTDISHSLEYGRQYIDLNRKYSDLFKARFVPPPDTGPFSDTPTITTDFTLPQNAVAIQWVDWTDGRSELNLSEELPCRTFKSASHEVSYLYFRVHDSFRWSGTQDLKLHLIAENGSNAEMDVQFDGSDTSAPFHGAYTLASLARRTRISQGVSSYEFDLHDARFLNSQNGGSDFRLRKLQGEFCIRMIQISKKPLAESDLEERPSLKISLVSSDEISLKVQGQPGTRYVVERSLDLIQWTAQSSVFIPSDQSSKDLTSPLNQPVQFFRLRNE